MEMQGETRLSASRDAVWRALNDPLILKSCIVGCEALDPTGDHTYAATVISRVGPIKARFTGTVSLSNIVAPRRYTLTGEGSGGAAGFAKADIDVQLDALEPELTLVRYSVNATVGGKLAQLGSRMIDAAARKSADDFFEAFGRQVAEATHRVPKAAVSAAENASTFDPADQAVSAEVTEVLKAELIKVWIADQIAVVTLNRPKTRNAMTFGMWRSIPSIFGALERNPEVRAIILTGAGEDFCAGADIAEFARVRDNVEQATAYEVAVDACCDAIADIAKPTIAVTRGYCLGGGAHLAMSCDFRYAAHNAVFGIPAARLSIIYGVRGTRKLLSLVGLPQAKKILFGAQRFSADEAKAIGFVDHVAATESTSKQTFWSQLSGGSKTIPAGDPMADARVFAGLMADNAPLSIAGAKFLLNGMGMGTGALDLTEAEALIAAASASDDYREGRIAFAEKRSARFLGC